MIGIFVDYNPKKLSLLDSKVIAKFQGVPEQRDLWNLFYDRADMGEARWVQIPYPCHSFAQEANMDLFSYTNFVEKGIFLDKEDPLQEWRNIEKNQMKYVDYLNNIDKIQVLGEDTNL